MIFTDNYSKFSEEDNYINGCDPYSVFDDFINDTIEAELVKWRMNNKDTK